MKLTTRTQNSHSTVKPDGIWSMFMHCIDNLLDLVERKLWRLRIGLAHKNWFGISMVHLSTDQYWSAWRPRLQLGSKFWKESLVL